MYICSCMFNHVKDKPAHTNLKNTIFVASQYISDWHSKNAVIRESWGDRRFPHRCSACNSLLSNNKSHDPRRWMFGIHKLVGRDGRRIDNVITAPCEGLIDRIIGLQFHRLRLSLSRCTDFCTSHLYTLRNNRQTTHKLCMNLYTSTILSLSVSHQLRQKLCVCVCGVRQGDGGCH